MKMLFTAIAASVLLSISATTARADPFVVEIDGAWAAGDDVNLRQSLGFVELEKIQAGDTTFLVVDAKSEAYVETYFRAKGVLNPKIMEIRFRHESEGPPDAPVNAVVVAWAISPFILPAY